MVSRQQNAAQLMLERHVSGLVVVDDDGVISGVLTEGDLLQRSELGATTTSPQDELSDERAAELYVRSHSWRVGDVMTKDVLVVDEGTPVARIAALMRENNFKRLPVVRDGAVIGIVGRADVLRAFTTVSREGNARGDDAMRRALATRLRAGLNLTALAVLVDIRDTIIRLSGWVASETVSLAAVVAAETVAAVSSVVNDLEVSEHPGTANTQDVHIDLVIRKNFRFHVRAALPDDKPALAEFSTHVTKDDLRFRFLSGMDAVGAERIAALIDVDHKLVENFLAFDDTGNTLIATAMLACDGDLDRGEVAITIRDDFKHNGISWELLAYLARVAAGKGVKVLESIENRGNRAAINLERDMGFTVEADADDPTLVIVRKRLAAA